MLAARFTGGDARLERGHDRGGQQRAQGLAVTGGIAAHDGLIGLTRPLEETSGIEGRIARLEAGDGGSGGRVQPRRGRDRRLAGDGRGLGLGRLYDRTGRLIATAAQEGLVVLPR